MKADSGVRLTNSWLIAKKNFTLVATFCLSNLFFLSSNFLGLMAGIVSFKLLILTNCLEWKL